MKDYLQQLSQLISSRGPVQYVASHWVSIAKIVKPHAQPHSQMITDFRDCLFNIFPPTSVLSYMDPSLLNIKYAYWFHKHSAY
jgi:hypothetical protein